ncbi:MAG: hypothetical protein ABFD08_14200 [Syntrophomonas sp.]
MERNIPLTQNQGEEAFLRLANKTSISMQIIKETPNHINEAVG